MGEVEAAQPVVLVAQVVVPVAQAEVWVAQAEVWVAQAVVPVAQAVQVVLEEADLALASIWEEIQAVAERMEDSRATCPLYSTGTTQKVTNSCRNSTS